MLLLHLLFRLSTFGGYAMSSVEVTRSIGVDLVCYTYNDRSRNLANTVARFSDGRWLVFNGAQLAFTQSALMLVGFNITGSYQIETTRREVLNHGVGLTECFPYPRYIWQFMQRQPRAECVVIG